VGFSPYYNSKTSSLYDGIRIQVKPTVLIFSTTRWFPTARLGMALANTGCTVDALCPSRHPLGLTKAPRQLFKYSNFAPLRSLISAVAAAHPDLIIPGDDLAAHRLHELYFCESRRSNNNSGICGLIERSLGSPESFPIVYQRASFMQLAQQAGVRIPKTAVIRDTSGLQEWMAEAGFPVVLKSDGSSGGEGVKVVRTAEEAQHAFRRLHAPPLLARALKRALLDGDTNLLLPSVLRRCPVVSAQAFVEGREANSTVACWSGNVLAALHFEVANKKHSTGHATVIRMIEHAEMEQAVGVMVSRLKLSGVHGFDFMLEAQTGNAYLIEINPRSTQVGHLPLGRGRDIPAALVSAMTESPVHAAPRVTERNTIALFPQEWSRDPASPFLQTAYHDVPWDEPELLRACVNRSRKQNRSLAQHDWEIAVANLMRLVPQRTPPSPHKQPE
jgi:ATP-grasp domain